MFWHLFCVVHALVTLSAGQVTTELTESTVTNICRNETIYYKEAISSSVLYQIRPITQNSIPDNMKQLVVYDDSLSPYPVKRSDIIVEHFVFQSFSATQRSLSALGHFFRVLGDSTGSAVGGSLVTLGSISNLVSAGLWTLSFQLGDPLNSPMLSSLFRGLNPTLAPVTRTEILEIVGASSLRSLSYILHVIGHGFTISGELSMEVAQGLGQAMDASFAVLSRTSTLLSQGVLYALQHLPEWHSLITKSVGPYAAWLSRLLPPPNVTFEYAKVHAVLPLQRSLMRCAYFAVNASKASAQHAISFWSDSARWQWYSTYITFSSGWTKVSNTSDSDIGADALGLNKNEKEMKVKFGAGTCGVNARWYDSIVDNGTDVCVVVEVGLLQPDGASTPILLDDQVVQQQDENFCAADTHNSNDKSQQILLVTQTTVILFGQLLCCFVLISLLSWLLTVSDGPVRSYNPGWLVLLVFAIGLCTVFVLCSVNSTQQRELHRQTEIAVQRYAMEHQRSAVSHAMKYDDWLTEILSYPRDVDNQDIPSAVHTDTIRGTLDTPLWLNQMIQDLWSIPHPITASSDSNSERSILNNTHDMNEKTKSTTNPNPNGLSSYLSDIIREGIQFELQNPSSSTSSTSANPLFSSLRLHKIALGTKNAPFLHSVEVHPMRYDLCIRDIEKETGFNMKDYTNISESQLCHRMKIDAVMGFLSPDFELVFSIGANASSSRHTPMSSILTMSERSLKVAKRWVGILLNWMALTPALQSSDNDRGSDHTSFWHTESSSNKGTQAKHGDGVPMATITLSELVFSGNIQLDVEVSNEFPYFGNSTIYFQAPPVVDMSVTTFGGIELSNIPGINALVRMLTVSVLDMVSAPNYGVIDTAPIVCPSCFPPAPAPCPRAYHFHSGDTSHPHPGEANVHIHSTNHTTPAPARDGFTSAEAAVSHREVHPNTSYYVKSIGSTTANYLVSTITDYWSSLSKLDQQYYSSFLNESLISSGGHASEGLFPWRPWNKDKASEGGKDGGGVSAAGKDEVLAKSSSKSQVNNSACNREVEETLVPLSIEDTAALVVSASWGRFGDAGDADHYCDVANTIGNDLPSILSAEEVAQSLGSSAADADGASDVPADGRLIRKATCADHSFLRKVSQMTDATAPHVRRSNPSAR